MLYSLYRIDVRSFTSNNGSLLFSLCSHTGGTFRLPAHWKLNAQGIPWGTHQITGAAGSLCCWEKSLKNLQRWRNTQGLPLEVEVSVSSSHQQLRIWLSGSKCLKLTSEIQVQHLQPVLSANPHYLGLSGSQLLLHILCCNSGFSQGCSAFFTKPEVTKAKSTVNLGGWGAQKALVHLLLLSSGIRGDNGQSVEASLSSHRSPSSGHPSPKEGQPGAAGRFQRVCLQPPTIQMNSTDDPGQCGVCTTLRWLGRVARIQLQARHCTPSQ